MTARRSLAAERATDVRDPFIARIERTSLGILLAMMVGAAMLRPGDWRLPLGVAGGGALMWLGYQGLRGGMLAAMGAGSEERATRRARVTGFVKFFTRHAMLALAGYAMLARLHLDPVGMLAGVTSPGLAAAAELVRSFRSARQHGRGSGVSRPL